MSELEVIRNQRNSFIQSLIQVLDENARLHNQLQQLTDRLKTLEPVEEIDTKETE